MLLYQVSLEVIDTETDQVDLILLHEGPDKEEAEKRFKREVEAVQTKLPFPQGF
jgi:hypothetical protein